MPGNFTQFVASICLTIVLAGCSRNSIDWSNPGAPLRTGFLTRQMEHNGKTYRYSVFIPHDYPRQAHYPVILFLHGLFESGSDGRQCTTVGIGPTVSAHAGSFPFIVVFPQSTGDWQGDKAAELALRTLDQVLHDYQAADRGRVILTGVSTGGDATWAIGGRFANRFAGLVPVSSDPGQADMSRLTKIPIWAFQNQIDPFRSTSNVRNFCDRLKQAGCNVTYTEFSSWGHDAWSDAYGNAEFLKWIGKLPGRYGRYKKISHLGRICGEGATTTEHP